MILVLWSASATAAEVEPAAVQPATSWKEPDWSELVPELKLRGIDGLLASNCALSGRDGDVVHLALDKSAETYLTRARQETLQKALSEHFGERLKIEITIGECDKETPLQKKSREENEDLQARREGLETDPNVVAMKNMFGATLDPDSVRVHDNNQQPANQE